MPWIELHITTSAEQANALSDQLSDFGAQAVTFQDAGNQPIFEPRPETPRLWHETTVIGLFSAEESIERVIDYLKKQAALGLLTHFHAEHLPDDDWERRCLDHFKPLRFGKRLWICPSWHQPPEPDAVNVILDPGLAFGTGTHPTTELCLEWLDEHITTEDLVIDYGCGSGILGLAALKLGAKKVIAIDNDPQALEATMANAIRNQLQGPLLKIQLTNATIDQKCDIIVANILAQPLKELASFFAKILKPNGKIILSGILKEQIKEVINAYNPLFYIEDSVYKDEWARLEAVLKISN